MRANQLRKRASSSPDLEDAHVREAQDILDNMTAFEPHVWAEGPLCAEWLIVANMYQAAAAIYCIASLQFLNGIPCSARMKIVRSEFGNTLFANLKKANRPKVILYTLWPMIVAGNEATDRGQKEKDWISKSLMTLSRFQGSASPLKARAVLKRFWGRELSGRDECFDRPFNFVV